MANDWSNKQKLLPAGAIALPSTALQPGAPNFIQGANSGSFWFEPLQPVPPTTPSSYRPRQYNYPSGANILWTPKQDSPFTFELLRELSRSWDLLRICLQMKKQQIVSVEYEIMAKRQPGEKGTDFKARNQEDKNVIALNKFFNKPDGFHRWDDWLGMWVEDMLVLDATALYLARDNKKRVAAVYPLDGANINRMITDRGITPPPPYVAYQQVSYGLPAFDFTTDDLVYGMMNEATDRRYGYCYDSETEILTRDRGWVRFAELNGTDAVATRNPHTREFEWQRPTHYTNEFYQGEMYHFRSRAMDLLVTPNHRMLISITKADNSGTNEKVVAAEEFHRGNNHERKIPVTSRWSGGIEVGPVKFAGNPGDPFEISGDDYCALMGAYLAEGNLRSAGGIEVAQQRISKGFAAYETLFTRINGRPGHNGRAFVIGRKSLTAHFKQFGHAASKFVPECIRNAPQRQLRIFWDYFVLGDGYLTENVNRSGRGNHPEFATSIVTTSRRLADHLVEIGQKLGFSVSVSEREERDQLMSANKKVKPYISHCQRAYRLRVRHSVAMCAASSPVSYQGTVHCVTVPNGIVYVRRNGKPCWSGNSPVEQLLLKISFGLRRDEFLLNEYTSGNVPEAMVFLPPGLTIEEVQEVQEWFDSIMGGNLRERRRLRFLPGYGTGDNAKPNVVFPKEAILKDEVDVWLAQLVCACLGMSAQPFLKMINRASAEESNDAAREQGLKPYVNNVCNNVNNVLEKMGYGDDYECTAKQHRDVDALKQAQVDEAVLQSSIYCVDEIREQRGEDRLGTKNSSRPGRWLATGWVPLDPDPGEIIAGMPPGHPNGPPLPPAPAQGALPAPGGKAPIGQPKASQPPGKQQQAGNKPPASGQQSGKPGPGTATQPKKKVSTGELAKYSYGSTQVDIDPASNVGMLMAQLRNAIPDAHLVPSGDPGDSCESGRETRPHFTVRYGIVPGSDTAGISDYLSSLDPFEVSFGPVRAFPPGGNHPDSSVLYVEVISDDLPAINAELANRGEFKAADYDYTPHATLAFVDPVFAPLYVNDDTLEGHTLEVNQITICPVDEALAGPAVVRLGDDEESKTQKARGGTLAQSGIPDGLAKYSEDQPREPAGSPEGGEFTSAQGGSKNSGKKWKAGDVSPKTGKVLSEKAARALNSANLTTREDHVIAEKTEKLLSKKLGIPQMPDNRPFDLENKKYGVEVKTIIKQTGSGKITMDKDALSKKYDRIAETKVKPFTIVADKRQGTTKYYYKAGVGSFNISSMTPATIAGLRKVLK